MLIPLCIYLNELMSQDEIAVMEFTFHCVSI